MIICGSYMFEFSVNKDMKKLITMIKGRVGGSREGSNTIMSNSNCQRIQD